MLYLVIALYDAFYFPPVHALAMLGFEGVAYAAVLVWGPGVPDPVASWLIIFGTGALLSGAVVTLVGALNRASHEDSLTRLPNRRTWDERMDDELERARRGGRPLTVVIFDVDNFKGINDNLGHVIGDRVLRHLAARWRAQLRTGGDFIARIGGDEFGLIAPETDAAAIQEVIARLQQVTSMGATCSFGAATWDGEESAASLFRRADEAMYQVKRERK